MNVFNVQTSTRKSTKFLNAKTNTFATLLIYLNVVDDDMTQWTHNGLAQYVPLRLTRDDRTLTEDAAKLDSCCDGDCTAGHSTQTTTTPLCLSLPEFI